MGRIFDPFFTTKGPDRGTGLGLSICFSVIRQSNGNISVESHEGSGAKFSVTLPYATGTEQSPPEVQSPHRARLGRPSRVLVVDDEEVVRILLQRLIRSAFGSHVDLAANGLDALGLTKINKYDMVVSDIRMPIMSGTELYLRLRECDPRLARNFAFITGHPGSPSLQEEINQWGVPVLAKPFTSAKLVEVCESMFSLEDGSSKLA